MVEQNTSVSDLKSIKNEGYSYFIWRTAYKGKQALLKEEGHLTLN